MKIISPKVYIVGYSTIDEDGLISYLNDSNNLEFLDYINDAKKQGLSLGEILCSFYAKLCYKSLTLGKNENVAKIRDIKSNLENVVITKHGSVLEHATINFLGICSRQIANELVRHRAGTAYSQNSGRYIRIDGIDFISDPLLAECEGIISDCLNYIEKSIKTLEDKTGLSSDKTLSFQKKKQLTSAIRRLAPLGMATEIGFTLNLRSLRHIIEMRTSRHAETEIRALFSAVAEQIETKFPHMLYGGQKELVDGYYEYTGLRV